MSAIPWAHMEQKYVDPIMERIRHRVPQMNRDAIACAIRGRVLISTAPPSLGLRDLLRSPLTQERINRYAEITANNSRFLEGKSPEEIAAINLRRDEIKCRIGWV